VPCRPWPLASSANLLVVVNRDDEVSCSSLRNIGNVHVIAPDQLNTYDVLISDDVVFTSGGLEAFLAGPAKGRLAQGRGHRVRSQ
jgi:large subunit ribosomal protein L4